MFCGTNFTLGFEVDQDTYGKEIKSQENIFNKKFDESCNWLVVSKYLNSFYVFKAGGL